MPSASTAIDDVTVPIPYIRRGSSKYVPGTTEYIYFEEVTSVVRKRRGTPTTARASETQTQPPIAITDYEEVITEEKKRKKTLTIYRKDESQGEDAEHFFEAFSDLRSELSQDWTKISAAKTNDATRLFEATDKMMDGVAHNLWVGQIQKYDNERLTTTSRVKDRTWEAYKIIMAKFITEDLFIGSEDAYAEQRQYMIIRTKPLSMSPSQWWNRIETIQNYLPYMIKSMDAYKGWVDIDGWKGWWVHGALRPYEVLQILEVKCPDAWTEQRRKVCFHPKTAKELVSWYEVLWATEQNNRNQGLRSHKSKMNRRNKNEDRSRHRDKFSRFNDSERRSRHYDRDKSSLGPSKKSNIVGKRYNKRQYQPYQKQVDKNSKQDKQRDEAYVIDSESQSDSDESLHKATAELYAMSFNEDDDQSSQSSANSEKSQDYHRPSHRTHQRRGRRGGRCG
jgi:hypothetical protein